MPAALKAEEWAHSSKVCADAIMLSLQLARAAHSAGAMLLVAGSRLLTLGVIKFHNLGRVNASASVGLEPVVHHSLMVCLQSLALLFEKLGSAWPGVHPCTGTPSF